MVRFIIKQINQNMHQEIKNTYQSSSKSISINKSDLIDGINSYEDFIVYKNSDEIKLFDRKCDHAGGRLISTNKNKIICPMHKWEFDPSISSYKNNITKPQIKFQETEELIKFNIDEDELVLPEYHTEKHLEIKFLNHACLIFEGDDFKFSIDPWIINSAFGNGWWLKYKSAENSFDELNSCDFIFISHTHPDHLHEESLLNIRKDMIFYTTDFSSKSSEIHLKSIGFNNVIPLKHDFGYIDADKEFYFSPLKSGDFRDDSGIILKYGKFSTLVNVDTNFINFFKLPKNLTMVASSFASGASGFPLCFENISDDEKKKIINLNKNSAKKLNENLVSITQAKYFLPYAGFFVESAARDSFIKEHNYKNTINDYDYFESKYDMKILNVENYQNYHFNGERLEKTVGAKLEKNNENTPEETIEVFKQNYSNFDKEFIYEYFDSSGFNKNFNLIVDLTNDNFISSNQIGIIFSEMEKPKLLFNENLKLDSFENSYNTLHLKIREEVFWYTLRNLMPWEDILVGFQMRVTRAPNIHNTDFWYHFSNVYTKYNASKIAKECTGCDLLKYTLVK